MVQRGVAGGGAGVVGRAVAAEHAPWGNLFCFCAFLLGLARISALTHRGAGQQCSGKCGNGKREKGKRRESGRGDKGQGKGLRRNRKRRRGAGTNDFDSINVNALPRIARACAWAYGRVGVATGLYTYVLYIWHNWEKASAAQRLREQEEEEGEGNSG